LNKVLKSFLSLLLGLALIIPFANPLSANQGDSVASEDKIPQIRTLYWTYGNMQMEIGKKQVHQVTVEQNPLL